MQSLQIDLGTVTITDDDREVIRPMIRRDDRLPSAEECATFVRLYGMRAIDLAAGAEPDDA